MDRITDIKHFYSLMFNTVIIRKNIIQQYYEESFVDQVQIDQLKSYLEQLLNIPKNNNKYLLLVHKNPIYVDLTYEIEEIKKDIYFLEKTFKDFYNYLSKLHNNFDKEVKEGINFLRQHVFLNFITDRDGTINNYCGRYSSSIQSVYNSVFITEFANNCTGNSIILTSAPLENTGLVDISINKKHTFVYAASKGREYYDQNGKRKVLPIEKEKQSKLDELNNHLRELIKQPKYQKYSLIGSGLQIKFGQTTIAHQDIYKSIPEHESNNLKKKIKNLIKNIDKNNEYFRIEDTGKDLEIILTTKDNNSSKIKDFDKGDGLIFLNEDLNLSMEKGPNLICGDTFSDIPMVKASMEYSTNTYSLFVTNDVSLKKSLKNICPNSYFVSEPDTLVTILHSIAKGV